MNHKLKNILYEYGIITIATLILVVGVYFFKFPNNFSFGGVTGIAVVLSAVLHHTASTYTFIINMLLLVVGFLFLGKEFGAKTVYVSVLTSVGLSVLEKWAPVSLPLTNQPMLELVFAILLPAVSAAIFFNIGASGGGTDIIAMILKKYTSVKIGTALFIVDLLIVVASCFVFDVQTGLFSLIGLLSKSLVIDNVIQNMNLSKAFMIVCDDPDPICDYICNQLNRSATKYKAEGAFTHHKKTIIWTVMKRNQAVALRKFMDEEQPGAFITIFNSSEIIGKGFHDFQ